MFSASGGLAYHLLALKNKKRWQPYLTQIKNIIADWIDQLPPDTTELILIGHSGGYSLPIDKIKKFKLICIDTDPLSHPILNLKLHNRPTWRTQDKHYATDWLINKSERESINNPLIKLINDHPNAAVCFCNLWGQVGVLSKDAEEILKFWNKKLGDVLKDKCWLSYHDRVSGAIRGEIKFSYLDAQKRLTNEQIIKKYFTAQDAEVTDHLTENIFTNDVIDAQFNGKKSIEQNKKHQDKLFYLNWNIKKNYEHIIEVICKI